MAKYARHHHYLSKCYLRGFTESGEVKSLLNVIDINRRNTFRTTPRNVGGVRDFNGIEVEGVKPDLIENGLAPFEGNVAASIRNIEKLKVFLGEDRSNVLNLISLYSVRSPQMREHRRKAHEDIEKLKMDVIIEKKERWESLLASMREDNIKFCNNIPYEKVKAFYKNTPYQLTLPTHYHLEQEFRVVESILPALVQRNWLLLIATNETGPFITTDRPVVLSWNEIDKTPHIFRDSPGFGCDDTQVMFPLSKSLMLIGEYQGGEGTRTATRELVALLNKKMLIYAYKQLYAPCMNFLITNEDGEITDGTKIL